MPISTIADRRSRNFDANLSLRLFTNAAISATQAETAISLVDKIAFFEAILDIAPYTGYTSGTNYWTIAIQVSVDNATWFTVQSFVPTGANQQRVPLPLSGQYEQSLTGSQITPNQYIRVTATKTGAPGNLTYGAWLQADLVHH